MYEEYAMESGKRGISNKIIERSVLHASVHTYKASKWQINLL